MAGQRTAGAQDSELHMDATLDMSDRLHVTARHDSDLHEDETLDTSDRQTVTTGLWQFSDREDLHEVGGKSSSSGNLHLRIPPTPKVFLLRCLPPLKSSSSEILRDLLRQEWTTVNGNL